MRKWRENEEGERFTLYISTFSLSCLPLYPFPISKFVTFCRKMLNSAFLSRMSQKLNIRAMRKYFWVKFSARKLRKLCWPAFLYQFHAQKAMFKVPKACNIIFGLKMTHPPLELSRKFIQFGTAIRP